MLDAPPPLLPSTAPAPASADTHSEGGDGEGDGVPAPLEPAAPMNFSLAQLAPSPTPCEPDAPTNLVLAAPRLAQLARRCEVM